MMKSLCYRKLKFLKFLSLLQGYKRGHQIDFEFQHQRCVKRLYIGYTILKTFFGLFFFQKASMGRTTIIIAHRLSTVKNADVIVAVQDGRVEEMGSHHELMEAKGVYYQLVMLQTLAEKEEHELSETGSIITEEERGLEYIFSLFYY